MSLTLISSPITATPLSPPASSWCVTFAVRISTMSTAPIDLLQVVPPSGVGLMLRQGSPSQLIDSLPHDIGDCWLSRGARNESAKVITLAGVAGGAVTLRCNGSDVSSAVSGVVVPEASSFVLVPAATGPNGFVLGFPGSGTQPATADLRIYGVPAISVSASGVVDASVLGAEASFGLIAGIAFAGTSGTVWP